VGDVTIIRYDDRPAVAGGREWYAIDGEDGSMLFARGDDAAGDIDAAGHVVGTWTGTRVLAAGSDKRGAAAYHLRFPVPDDFVDEFDAWYRHEHAPLLLEEPTWYACELFRATRPSLHSFTVIHYLEPEARQSEVPKKSMQTPWWKRLARNDWWDSEFVRTMLTPIGD
jgi:hypothetical protein